MTGSFTRRRINLQFQLGTGDFGAEGQDVASYEGLRISCTVTKNGGVSMSTAELKIFGLPLDVMNKLTILGQPIAAARQNSVTISAGDNDKGLAAIFVGTITEAWVDARNAPQVAFIVTAHTGMVSAFRPVPPTSYKGSVDVATIVQGIAAQMEPPLTLVNNGVSAQIADAYLYGTAWDQLKDIARWGNFHYIVDDAAISIWPVDGSRSEERPQRISAETGMVGYPMHTQSGIALTTLYNPSLVFGALVEVESVLVPASGTWRAYSVVHDLESETPGGKWFTTIQCSTLDYAVPIA